LWFVVCGVVVVCGWSVMVVIVIVALLFATNRALARTTKQTTKGTKLISNNCGLLATLLTPPSLVRGGVHPSLI
jgi:hypothetical protein